MFYKKRQIKQKNARVSAIRCAVMEAEGMHFEIFLRKQVVKYRNVISPRDGGMNYPDEYFAEKKAIIPKQTLSLISQAFDRMLPNLTPTNKIHAYIPWAAYDSYMEISYLWSTACYINIKSADFIEIIQLLREFCFVPKCIPEIILEKWSPEFLEKINADIKSDTCRRLIGCRIESPGTRNCVYYENKVRFCSVSDIAASSSQLMVNGGGMTWRSDFDISSTIFPGLTRYINDESDGKQIFRIVYKDRGKYIINESIEVYCNNDQYAFYCNDQIIATIKGICSIPEYLQIAVGTDSEPCFDVSADNGINTETLMVIAAFPLLRFAF